MSNPNIQLAPGEKGLYSRNFRPNLLLFWLQTTMVVTNKRIMVRYPNTLLGIIPLGYEESSMPIGSVAGINTAQRVNVGRLLLFGVLALISFVIMIQGFSGGGAGMAVTFLILMIVFGAMAANAITSALVVTNNGGGKAENSVSILDKAALQAFTNKANEIIYSASTSGSSWDMQYANNQEGFQNRANYGIVGHPGNEPEFGGNSYRAPEFTGEGYGNPGNGFGNQGFQGNGYQGFQGNPGNGYGNQGFQGNGYQGYQGIGYAPQANQGAFNPNNPNGYNPNFQGNGFDQNQQANGFGDQNSFLQEETNSSASTDFGSEPPAAGESTDVLAKDHDQAEGPAKESDQ